MSNLRRYYIKTTQVRNIRILKHLHKYSILFKSGIGLLRTNPAIDVAEPEFEFITLERQFSGLS